MTDQLDLLATAAQQHKPRLFTIYGLRRTTDDPFLGWGMAFEELGTTVYYQPDSHVTHCSDTPDQILALFRHISGAARLEWLDQM